MIAKNLLDQFFVGNSVAEFDEELDRYFVETETFTGVISGKFDVVSGDKGTGKTAIFRVLMKNYRSYDELESVEVIPAFNIQGNPVFQRIATKEPYSEDQYRTLWKAYILSLAGNWLIDIYGPDFNDEVRELKNTLDHLGLSAIDVTPESVFGNVVSLFDKLSNPKSAEVEFSVTETGLPVIVPKVEFGGLKEKNEIIYSDDFLLTLDAALLSAPIEVWVALDRLDEAFQGHPETEVPALRALFRTYLDLSGLKSLKLKMFVRHDLFRRIIKGGFVNLTHINARKVDIVWDDEDLFDMLVRRISLNEEFLKVVEKQKDDTGILEVIFPDQVDVGEKRPTTLNWIVSRIRDGNDSKPPRNLLDLVNKSREVQLRRERRSGREIDPKSGPLIEGDSLKRALSQLSEQRVQDTLLAESGDYAQYIEKFRDGKAEHNKETLYALFDGSDREKETVLRALIEIGFLEEIGSSFKIPMLYRDGLSITQGKAFD